MKKPLPVDYNRWYSSLQVGPTWSSTLDTDGSTGSFNDPHKAAEDLQAFAKLNEPRLYKLLKTCMDPQTDLKGLVKATVRP